MKVIKKYNYEKQVVEKSIYSDDLKLNYTFYYGYDETGNCIKITKKLSDESVEWKNLYTYDINGICTEIKSYDSNENLKSYLKYAFEYYNNSN